MVQRDQRFTRSDYFSYLSYREEIWNSKVAEAIRVRVFKQAAESFEKSFGITESGKDLLAQLIVRFWTMTSLGDGNTINKVIKPLLADWVKGAKDGSAPNIHDGRSGIEAVKQLKRPIQYRLLFLLVHGHKGAIGFGNVYRSQMEVKEIAAEFKVDYTLLDAEVRLEFSSKKHREVHRLYLDDVRAKSKDAKVPRPFSENWTPVE